MSAAARLDVALPGDCEVRMTRLVEAQRERIYDAYTRPDLLKRWLGPEGFEFVLCDNEATTGGRYRWLWRNAQGHELGMRGEYLKVVPPQEIVRTEIFEQAPHGMETVGRLRLTAQTGGTLVTTSVLFPTQEARDGALAAGMDRGIAASFDRLDLLLSCDRDSGGSQAGG